MIARETTLNELGQMLSHVVEHMATKDDLIRVDRKLESIDEHVTSIQSELVSIRRDLDDLMEKYGNISGYGKEIDHAFERIANIEKHLGIKGSAHHG